MADLPVTLRAKLAPVYGHLFSEFFDRPSVVETRATCDTCSMCDHGQLAPVAMDYFRPDTKCCTFHPNLPNYMVGAILADDGEELAEGRKRLRARIAARVGVTPGFISAPRKYNVLYGAARGNGVFGRSLSLICPYYDNDNGGRCTVWRYRESVCSTYFCKYTAGKPGYLFWDTLKSYLSHVERSLSYYASHMVDPTAADPKIDFLQLTREDLEDLPPNDADYASYWGNGKWVGREEEFYVACYKHVLAVSKAEFEKHVDDAPDGRGLRAKLEAKYDEIMRPELPKVLVRATSLRKRDAGENVVVSTYNAFDAFSLEKELFDVLGLFRAEETLEENLARLDKENDIQLAPELIKYLYTHGVLAPPEPAPKKAEKRKMDAAQVAATTTRAAAAAMAAERQAQSAPGAKKAPEPAKSNAPAKQTNKKKR